MNGLARCYSNQVARGSNTRSGQSRLSKKSFVRFKLLRSTRSKSNVKVALSSTSQSIMIITVFPVKLGVLTQLAGGGGVLPYKRLMRMCRWMGSHFHDWTDYNEVAYSIELLE